ncbi:hypothetical protein SAMN05421799_101115 [Alicyclobacillus vulcanalis]|uniref:Uncharacterized protein n=1 Tax=Alicyclobacillus vulcanalis TaxID=252246 RepID=A0A1N7JPV6_9BACL|nr:hypothetical protein SAMN05421799_101115 [Alicyclobacillus vulcanalis]
MEKRTKPVVIVLSPGQRVLVVARNKRKHHK